jgi:hypothetical protein
MTRLTHGHAARKNSKTTRAYMAWQNMKRRCVDPNRREFKNYGGRSLGFDREWESFDSFLRDMGEPPAGTSLDRKDNSRGYSKDNCRWATKRQQVLNTRRNRTITHRGVSLTLFEWAEKLKINYSTLRARIDRGWSLDRAMELDKSCIYLEITQEANVRI